MRIDPTPSFDRVAGPTPSKLDGVALALSLTLFAVSLAAFALQLLAVCGACTMRQGPWMLVAPLGVIGYGVLTTLGGLGRHRLFRIGAAVAAGVHTVLLAAMLAGERMCALCVVAATLAAALFFAVLVRSTSRLRMIAGAYLPAVVLASGSAAWALAQDRDAERRREAFVRRIRDIQAREGLTLQVFEQDHCGYCRDFREFYLPRLERDFRHELRVRFLAADASGWVRRTPTLVVEGGPIFEGLPRDYQELRSAVEEALRTRKELLR